MLDKQDYNKLLVIEAACKALFEQIKDLRAKAERDFNPSQRKIKKAEQEANMQAYAELMFERRQQMRARRFKKQEEEAKRKASQ